jgi:CRP-like cAMP-binding protein
MASLQDAGSAFENRLLAILPREELNHLAPYLELVRLTPGKILYHAGEHIRHAYFLKGGMVCLLSTTESGRTIEVGMIGNEGLIGIPIILRCNSASYQVTVQLATNALRIRGDVLRAAFNHGGVLQDLLLRFTHTLLTQIAQSAACNRFHTIEERLCRWLLTSHDRVQTETLHLTHEFLSHMLGVPRTSVTMIAKTLQHKNLITYTRGKITILDRRGLEIASCECYRLINEGIQHYLVA